MASKKQKKLKTQGLKEMTPVRDRYQIQQAEALKAWMVVRPMSGQERFMLDVARSKGFATYQPRIIRSRYNAFQRQQIVTTEAMFPGYVLVQAQPGAAWEIFSMPGVMPGKVGVLPWAFLDSFVQELRKRERNGIINDVARQAKSRRVHRIPTIGGLVDALLDEDGPIDMNRISVVTGLFKGAARATCSLDQVIKH